MTPAFQSFIYKVHRAIRCIAVLTGVAFLLPFPANALEFQCERDGDVRHLRVDIPGAEHLCEVNVQYILKKTNKVVWHANSDTLFCSAKNYELKGKYENEWGFTCMEWPDRDGIDKLSLQNRTILDHQLKQLIRKGELASEPFTVIRVKAAASSLLNNKPGLLALQYFLSNDSDITQIILSESSDSWSLMTTIDNLTQYITGDHSVNTALISSISDSGALEVITTLHPVTAPTTAKVYKY